MRILIAPTLFACLLIASGASPSVDAADWERRVSDYLPVLGHRNWIVIADAAYPEQVARGVKTMYIGGSQIDAVERVLKLVRDAPHVRPVPFTDAELRFVPEVDAPGIAEYRRRLKTALANVASTEEVPHDEIISTLEKAGESFRVLILKTDLTLPYTSVFIRLDAGYWTDDAESRLRSKMEAAVRSRKTMEPIQDAPGLPRVLLIGDSISIGYTLPVRELLTGIANVHRPMTNCGPTTNGLKNLDAWLGDKPWDVIHFNFGLHDLKYVDDQGHRVPPKDGHLQVAPAEYEANLTEILKRLKQTNARLIWRTTTPVPQGAHGRVPGDAAKYNEIALRAVRDILGEQVIIDDQYAYAMEHSDRIQRPGDVHFTQTGYQELAQQAFNAIFPLFAPDQPASPSKAASPQTEPKQTEPR